MVTTVICKVPFAPEVLRSHRILKHFAHIAKEVKRQHQILKRVFKMKKIFAAMLL